MDENSCFTPTSLTDVHPNGQPFFQFDPKTICLVQGADLIMIGRASSRGYSRVNDPDSGYFKVLTGQMTLGSEHAWLCLRNDAAAMYCHEGRMILDVLSARIRGGAGDAATLHFDFSGLDRGLQELDAGMKEEYASFVATGREQRMLQALCPPSVRLPTASLTCLLLGATHLSSLGTLPGPACSFTSYANATLFGNIRLRVYPATLSRLLPCALRVPPISFPSDVDGNVPLHEFYSADGYS
ncbi:hypothetical protein MSAN_00248700 [Mycena sanguinolenta]|uniref:Uncharacterized protein n=1 Tax=Mycena sanguinolenta TaxID=230812 RepID=A0A8H7DMW4_9AGAR|nr:hypothetical protein MSAN_00248700 [Mycena sanguinolenta]